MNIKPENVHKYRNNNKKNPTGFSSSIKCVFRFPLDEKVKLHVLFIKTNVSSIFTPLKIS